MSNPTQNLGLDEIYVDAAVNENLQKIDANVVNKNGTVPFVAEQIGVDPVNPQGLATKHYVDLVASAIMPDYTNGVSKSWNTQYTAESDGWLYIYTQVNNTTSNLTIDGQLVAILGCTTVAPLSSLVPISKDSTYIGTGSQAATVFKFYPTKGAN